MLARKIISIQIKVQIMWKKSTREEQLYEN